MPIFSCMECDHRHINCHSTCEVYIREKAEHDKLQREIREENFVDQYITNKKCKARYSQLKKYGKSHV